MRTIIAGTRHTPLRTFNRGMQGCPFLDEITAVVSGGCPDSPDILGEGWAKKRGIPIDHYPADWDLYGAGAGFIRNEDMANNADALIAIWDGKSNGTADMIKRASRKGLRVYVFPNSSRSSPQLSLLPYPE